MNKTVFEVGKTYITRDGSEADIISRNSFTLEGTVTKTNGKRIPIMWLPTGSSVYYDDKEMDLMPEEIQGKKYDGFAKVDAATIAAIDMAWDSEQHKLKEENVSLFKANLDLLEEVDALQKENFGLRIELQEARLIAQGMVDAAKISIPAVKCSCGYFYRVEDKHMFPKKINGIYGFYICRDCNKTRDLHESQT